MADQEVYAVFIDLVSAYDNVDRRVLEERLIEEEVLSEDQLEMWRYLCTAQTVTLGDGSVTATNGIPQGSTIAPGLWNVYCNSILRELASLYERKVRPAAVADDSCILAISWWLLR